MDEAGSGKGEEVTLNEAQVAQERPCARGVNEAERRECPGECLDLPSSCPILSLSLGAPPFGRFGQHK